MLFYVAPLNKKSPRAMIMPLGDRTRPLQPKFGKFEIRREIGDGLEPIVFVYVHPLGHRSSLLWGF